jgi:hypothetical protein
MPVYSSWVAGVAVSKLFELKELDFMVLEGEWFVFCVLGWLLALGRSMVVLYRYMFRCVGTPCAGLLNELEDLLFPALSTVQHKEPLHT